MLGSQALETAIGLVLMFFVISVAASSFVEIVSRLLRKRANDLEKAIGDMLAGRSAGDTGADVSGAIAMFKGTSVYEALQAGARRSKPSYVSARAFAEAVGEMLDGGEGVARRLDELPAGLRRRLESIARQPAAAATTAALAVKSGLETWFDETMGRLQGAYKRWTTVWVFGFGLAVAILANASTFHTAERLWHDPTTREAVANAASRVGEDEDLDSVAETTEKLDELAIPVGWDDAARDRWRDGPWGRLSMVLGWLLTALLVMLGAPFWFDLLTRLVSLRSAGAKPPPAAEDPASATTRLATTQEIVEVTAPAPAEETPAAAAARAVAAAPGDPATTVAAAFGLAPATTTS